MLIMGILGIVVVVLVALILAEEEHGRLKVLAFIAFILINRFSGIGVPLFVAIVFGYLAAMLVAKSSSALCESVRERNRLYPYGKHHR